MVISAKYTYCPFVGSFLSRLLEGETLFSDSLLNAKTSSSSDVSSVSSALSIFFLVFQWFVLKSADTQ